MSDDGTVLIGVKRCGCVTAILLERYATKTDLRDFYRTMADTDREVRRLTAAEFEASRDDKTFLGCSHAGVSS